jgi:predicted dehydrogenase
MGNPLGRREFIRTTVAGSAALGLGLKSFASPAKSNQKAGKIGIIGLDTSHATAFTKALNDKSAGDTFGGFKIVAAYPRGSNDIKSSTDRIPGYTEEVKKYGVEIVNSVDELIKAVDFVLLETNDGRLHLEQALPVLKAGKRMFIDKPVAASLSDAIAIFNAAEHYKVPVFSASSLRYISGAKEIAEGSIGKVLGADTYSPCSLEKTHPDLFWYGIHGVETLFTVMGTGCKTVSRSSTADFDKAVGVWNDGRIGSFRGIRSGRSDYGGTVFGEKGIAVLGKYAGYNPLLERIIKFFQDGVPPVTAAETIEIFAFMAAADESKSNGGAPADLEKVLAKARKKASKITFS